MRVKAFLKATLAVSTVAMLGACMSSSNEGFIDDNGSPGIVSYPTADVCGRVREGGGASRCMAKVRVNPDGTVKTYTTPQGFGPADLQSAYELPTSGGAGRIVAAVDAYDDPTAEADLAVYRSTFGLPPCTTANGCFQKVNETGATAPLPSSNSGWAGEISLDLDMISAGCPDCKILLVEVNSATNADLGAGVNTAAKLGASAISNSYGGPESASDPSTSSTYYAHAGILVTASAGDSGYGAAFPATSPAVLAVGGTSLTKASNSRGWSETAWNDGGSGCSAYEAKPSWQTDASCSKRMEADVSSVSDPNTGLAVYQTTGAKGWSVYGGTSAASPLVASVFTLLGLTGQGPGYVYSHTSDFHDVTSGSNGSCGGTYFCTAGTGYDGPTGWGTPDGEALAGGGSSSSSSGSSSGSSGGSSGSSSGSSGGSSGSSSGSSGGSSGSSGGSSSGSGGGSSGSSSGGTGTCSHAVCATGGALTAGCDPCAGDVCAKDPYCCQTQWDDVCVSEVPKYCGETCSTGGSGGACAHSVCSAGADLTSTCDACAGDVCAKDSYCCSVLWDNICVAETKDYCAAGTCP